jgi:protein-tyrosine phosphatase
LLDVDEADIVADFALTGLATERLRAAWITEHGEGRPPLWPGYGYAPAEVMELFLAGLAKDYGSVRGYAEQRLGIGDALVERLRETLLEG